MMSQNMATDPNLQYIENSYKAIGNNGNCYDNSINNINCGGIYNQQVRDNLYNMSDHLPVVMELETAQQIVILETPEQVVAHPFSLKATLVSNTLTLYTPQLDRESLHFSIYNTLGQEIETFNVYKSTTILNVSHISNGIYYISNQSSNQTLKFVKPF
ncbi:MAG: hypothetical protein ACI849_001328 [Patiriisocius sp.]|jgi:hypothetical protein